MPNKPILIFPTKSKASRSTGNPVPTFLSKPTVQRQTNRLDSKFSAVVDALQNRSNQIAPTADGYEPEMVLVFELRGTVEDFFAAVNRIPELEWMGEYEQTFASDEDFFNVKDKAKTLDGKIYFLLSNRQSLDRILGFWATYKAGTQFPFGTAAWRNVFSLLYEIRPWGLRDRLEETGLLEDIKARLEHEGQSFPIEIELWYRENEKQRADVRQRIVGLTEQAGGQILSESVIKEIGYHGMLLEASPSLVAELTSESENPLFNADEIMYLRPMGHCLITNVPSDEVLSELAGGLPEPTTPPVLALLDGLPLQNHNLLSGRIIVDDPNNYEDGYPADKRLHGTGMASIIIHGDKNNGLLPIRSTLYVRPVMKYVADWRDSEFIPEDRLTVDIIHEAVKGIFDNQTLAKTIKVINLSLGDPTQPYINRVSSWGKLIDWLSFHYNVLFVVSAGNCPDDIDLGLTAAQYRALIGTPDELDKQIILNVHNNSRHRRIISPSESINALTIGATHLDGSAGFHLYSNVGCFASSPLFSPISRLGSGYRRSIKPDLVMPGGRVIFQDPSIRGKLVLRRAPAAPGIMLARPEGIDRLGFDRGTSNAAALTSRTAALLHESLVDAGIFNQINDAYFPVLAKALLVHTASWNEACVNTLTDCLGLGAYHPNVRKAAITKFIGYGNVREDRVGNCSDQRVTLIACGELIRDDADEYSFPIPQSIAGSLLWKQLTVTLAWFTPVNSKSQRYRKAKLWFDFPEKEQEKLLRLKREMYDSNAVRRGTVQHEVWQANRASVFAPNSTIKIKVNSREDARNFNEKVPYALAVTLEIDNSVPIDIYTEIRQTIQPQVQVS